MKLTKREKAYLRSLAAEAHEEDLSDALMELYEEFGLWAEHEMSPFELVNRIHRFHDGIARELHSLYVMPPAEIAVAAALSRGRLRPEAIDPDVLNKIWIT